MILFCKKTQYQRQMPCLLIVNQPVGDALVYQGSYFVEVSLDSVRRNPQNQESQYRCRSGFLVTSGREGGIEALVEHLADQLITLKKNQDDD